MLPKLSCFPLLILEVGRMSASAGSGYFISPDEGPGPGVLLLHGFLGLDRGTKDMANELADLGFTVLAPDLANGHIFEDEVAAVEALAHVDMNVSASLVQSSTSVLRQAQADPDAPIGVVGLGPGASFALWLSVRLVEEVGAVATYYGSQNIDMSPSKASYLAHWASDDAHVDDFAVADLGLSLKLADRPFEFRHHDDVSSGFAEASHPNFDGEVAAVAWRQTSEFLASLLHP